MKSSKTVFAFMFLILFSSSNLKAQNPADKKPEKPKNKIDYMDYCIKDPKKMNFKSREIKIESANETKINFRSGKKHVYLKLKDYPSKSKLKLLKKYNINLDNFIDDKAYLVELDQNKLNALKKMGFIEGVAEIQPRDKLSKPIKDRKVPEYAIDGNYVKVIIAFHKGVTFDEIKKALKNFNCKIESKKLSFTNKITVSIDESELEELASLEMIKYIEEIAPPKAINNVDAGKLSKVFWGDPTMTGLYDTGYLLKGQGIKVAVEDGGMIYHPDFDMDRVKTDVDNEGTSQNYHATHVAGTIGLNIEYDNDIPLSARGMASEVILYSYCFSNTLTNDIVDDYLDAVSRSISIINNSWGHRAGWDYHWKPTKQKWEWDNINSYLFGAYSSTSEDLDTVMYNFYDKQLVLIKSAGNHRNDKEPDPKTEPPPPIDEFAEIYPNPSQYDGIMKVDPEGVDSGKYFCIDDTSCAKNVITVGAVGYPIGELDCDTKSSYFSSWGPTKDWRIKPDVVADGWHVLSSTMVIDNDGNLILDNEGKIQYTYKAFDGTSMAAPVVTGITALIFQSFKDRYGRFPTADIVKALLCNFAQDLGRPGPDPCYGFGLVKAKPIIDAIDRRISSRVSHIATGTIMGTDSELEYKFAINEPTNILSEDLKVTLAWVDPPSIPTDNATLINDLDMEIYEENNPANKFYSFYFDNEGESTGYIYHMKNEGLEQNHVDNIEQIVIPKGTQITNGNYVIKVKGYALNFLEQNFAIVSTIPMNNINFSDLSVRESRTNEEPGEWVSCNKLVVDETPDVRMMITELDNNGPDNGFEISSIKYKYSTDAGANWNNDWLDVSGVYKDENCTESCGVTHSGIAYAKIINVPFNQKSTYKNKIQFKITYKEADFVSAVYTIKNDNIFYVDRTAASDGTGTDIAPYKSINTAVWRLSKIASETTPVKLYVREGTYNETVYLERNIELYGGYDAQGNRDILLKKTKIEMTSWNRAVVIYNADNVVIDGFEIIGKAILAGGGILISSSESVTISNCIIKNCIAVEGGGIYSINSGIYINNCYFKQNQVSGSDAAKGGALWVANNEYTKISNSVFYLNTADNTSTASTEGGAIYVYATLFNSIIDITNCIFCDNTSDTGGALYSTGMNSEHIKVTNSIFWNYQSGTGTSDFYIPANVDIKNCCIQNPDITGTGVIHVNPQLFDPQNDDFHLRYTSPCINAGTNQISELYNDFDGDLRIDEGFNICDIGADEYIYQVVYVDTQGNNQNEGSSSSPYQTIQYAINVSQGTERNIALIRVKSGTYNEDITLEPYLMLIGGFGDTWNQRDITANETIIRGTGTTHVVVGANYSILDGFTLTNGNALNGGGIYMDGTSSDILNCKIKANSADYGGGIYINSSSLLVPPVIENCVIEQNTAMNCGGGIYYYDSDPEIVDCIIDSNNTENVGEIQNIGLLGGGIYAEESGGIINNCNIINNTCDSVTDYSRAGGGGAYIRNSAIQISGCTFEYNYCDAGYGYGGYPSAGGGGIYFSGDNNTVVQNSVFKANECFSSYRSYGGGVFYGSSNSKLLGCIFYFNSLISTYGDSWERGRGIYVAGSPFITNCTLYGGAGEGIYLNSGTLNLTNSIVWLANIENYGGTLAVSDCCLWSYVQGTNIIYTDPLFKDPGNGDFHLQENSPCIDAGNDQAVGLDLLQIDIDGEPRIDTRHVEIDIGADETIDIRYYVSDNEGSNTTGKGFKNNPWKTIQYAINNVSANENQNSSILVMAGTYKENIVLKSNINLSGGYGGNWVRNLETNKTIIDGDNKGSVIVADGPVINKQTIYIHDITLDGFKITNGKAEKGGGIYIRNAFAEISNCDIVANQAKNSTDTNGFGGGIYFINSSVEIADSKIRQNTSLQEGGGIYASDSDANHSFTINNSEISENLSKNWGGGIYASVKYFNLDDSLVTENIVIPGQGDISYGGGIYLSGTTFNIEDSVFDSNSARSNNESRGGGLYVSSCPVNSKLLNTVFRFNTSSWETESGGKAYGGGLFIYNSYLKILGCQIYSNSAENSTKNGEGIYCDNIQNENSITITNCNIIGNGTTIENVGNGLCSDKAKIYNSIIWDNSIVDKISYNGRSKFYNCCIQGSYSNISFTDVIHDEPKFFDLGNGEFHIFPYSPCVDNGKSNDMEITGLNLLLKDIDGQGRIDLASGKCDIGVDEVHAYYVDSAVSDQGQGTKSSPWKTIQHAIDTAYNTGFKNMQIYVKGGIYYENITLRPNIFLYGGFDDTWERDLESNPSIIDGNGTSHTVSITSSSGTFTWDNSVIDGFIITNGNSTNGGGLYLSGVSSNILNCTISASTATNGGGIYINGGSPKLEKCVIEQNVALYGGGTYIYNTDINMSDCTIRLNIAQNVPNPVDYQYGGGIYADTASGSISNCEIINNSCTADDYYNSANGGGAYIYNSSLNVSGCIFDNNECRSEVGNYTRASGGGIFFHLDEYTVIKNSIFKNNKAISAYRANAGAISFSNSSNYILGCIFYSNDVIAPNEAKGDAISSYGSPTITNCTIYENDNSGIGVYNENGSITLTNCILWGNGDEIYNRLGTIPLNSCCIEDSDNGPGVIHDNPQLFDPDYGDFHLRSDSPCIDAGNDGAIGLNLLETDVYGEPRIDSAANNCDMGADEFNHIYYVAKNGSNQGAGNSEHPWATIQYAINTAQSSQTEVYSIYVQEGTYNENVVLKSYVNLHGGYDSNWQRDVASNPTSIQVTGGSAVTASANSIIDGFTISGGNTTGGSGVRIHQITDAGTVSVSNCIIENNTAVGSGAGFSAYECPQIEVRISGCNIRNNMANTLGGAAFIQNTKVVMSNCKIENNTATVGGGIDFTGNKEVIITNSSFVNNVATSTTAPRGGGIYATGAIGKISNCDFRNNTALSTGGTEVKGGGLCITASTFEVSDSIFDSNMCSSNIANVYGGGICVQHNGNNFNTIIKNCTVNGNLAYSSTNAYGGAVEILNSGVKLLGSVVCNNYAEGDNDGKGGAIDISVGTYQNYVTNSQIYGNIASTEQFGGVAKRSGTLAISNSILWNNDNDIYGTADLANCCIQDNDDGTGVIHDDPMFVNPENGDFHLQENSPCIDAGNDGAVGVDLLNKDIDSQYRINNNVDIGTDEYYN